ncbi:glycosyltransferase family 4 protein [Melghirimyces algeriensis]|uniref:Glycosyltransferase involved in cell wall bisynthesis n=1 Tax=Melghirimyces algeriensis TaxID=910412 RepID=A0A521D6Q6_9BACL|nr:glycosyltransferase family 4 protein [Melghirimyces algeriensis]SMO66570.1 Glycosyltransferase involved in cell wall bisynthesis [Melghirimyces algeriensis]
MHIWIANHYAVPPNIGGITRHYELACEWTNEEQTEVTLWLSSFNHSRRRAIDEESKRELKPVPGLHLRWIWSFPHSENDIRRVLNMLSFAFLFLLKGLFRRRPDVLFASTPHLLTPLSGWILSKVKRCPFVLEVRDLWPDTLVKMGGLKNPLMIKVLSGLERFLYKKANKIVVLTEYQRKFIQSKGIDAAKISLIPNGIVKGSWKPDSMKRKTCRRRMGIAPHQFLTLYAGAHGPANALEYVVRAGEYLPDHYAIVLIGDGPEKNRLQKIKKERGLHNVHFYAPVSKDEIYNYIDAADCGVISLADNEIFRGARPNKLFDYMYVGKPIITTVDGEVREIVEGNRLGLFSGAESAQGLAEAIVRIRSFSVHEKEQIANRGRWYIEQYGDRQKLAAHLYRELESLLCNGIRKINEVKRSG